eukprot:s1213_g9.t1
MKQLARLVLLLGAAADSESHVWLERNSDGIASTESVSVDETVTVRWDHFINGDKGWYSWGFVRESQTNNFLGSVTGNTQPTGRFAWQVPSKLCGRLIEIEMCSGSPPRRTKHACHKSTAYRVEGTCVPDVPTPTTTTTTLYAALKEMGPLDLRSRSRSWKQDTRVPRGPKMEMVKGEENSSVALVVVWLGKLPPYVRAFVKSARDAGVSFFIFHTHNDELHELGKEIPSNVKFQYMPLEELAKRLWKIDAVRGHFNLDFDSFTHRVQECYADDNPAKGNDLKPLYGALFQEELAEFTHWGWTDLDMIWGNVGAFLKPLLSYDVISAPDGQRPALYLSGQLTVFRNQEIWRRFVDGCIDGPGHVNYAGCYVESFLSEANVYFDEKIAIWYAALQGAQMLFDFSLILTDARWQRLAGQQRPLLKRQYGRLVVPHTNGLPFVDIEQRNMEVHLLQNTSNCFSEFGEGWSYVCIPFDVGSDAFGASYEVFQNHLYLWPAPLHAVKSGSQFAAFHLHKSKRAFQDVLDCGATGSWLCYKEASKVVCACSEDGTAESPRIVPTFPIPNIVHFVLTDRDTRFFDWPCYVAIRSAWEKLQPEKLLVHVLDGVEPATAAEWWLAAKQYITAVVPFARTDVPLSLNDVKISHPAFIADFRRIQILRDWGGIYMDTDALSLRSFDSLRSWKAVFGRQGGQELRATVGLMMFEKNSHLLETLLERMKRAYTGAWGVHAGHVLDDLLREVQPKGVAILGHSSGFFASSWHAEDFVELMEESGLVDWSRCWSLHLYNSQTKKYTKDPVELCQNPASPYRGGDLCKGLAIAADMPEIYRMVGEGYPLMSSRIKEAFDQRAADQAAAFSDPVSHSLDVQPALKANDEL